MKQMKQILSLLIFFLAFQAKSNEKLNLPIQQGMWHVEMQINDSTFLPFFMQFDDEGLTVINDEEKILIPKVRLEGDSIICTFPIFNTYLKGKVINDQEISGFWYYPAKGPDYKIPFIAQLKDHKRFEKYRNQKESEVLAPKYEIYFDPGTEDEFPAIGRFSQGNDGKISGTFLTETGDFRFLSGNVFGNRFYLSTFDGAHAFLFEGTIKGDEITGTFYSGIHYQTTFTGVANQNYELTDPNKLTYLTDPGAKIEFEFKDLQGQSFHFPEDADPNKVTIIQIMGSWCPNCKDETAFYKELKEKYQSDLQIISVGFEVGKTFEDKANAIERLQAYFDTDFTYLVGGNAHKGETSEAFPMLNQIISYPTSIFIDKKGGVALIHTGFSGPGTGIYYTNYKKQTFNLIDRLVKE